MTVVAFEARRLTREVRFVLVAVFLHAASLVQSILDGGEPAGMVLFAPRPAVWVAAGDTAADARGGRLDFVVTRGPTLPGLQLARFLLGWGCRASLLAASSVTLVAAGPHLAYWLEYLGLVGYWAAVGALLGQRVSAAATLLLGQLPDDWPEVLVTAVLQSIGCAIPFGRLSWLASLPAFLAWLPWLPAPVVLALAVKAARRRQLFAQEEG